MLKCFKKINKKDTGVFAAGLLFGTAGIKLLSSKDAKKSLHKLCSRCFTCERVCIKDSNNNPGKMLRYLCRSTAD